MHYHYHCDQDTALLMADRVLRLRLSAHACCDERRCYPCEDRGPTDRCEAQNYGWHKHSQQTRAPAISSHRARGLSPHLHHTGTVVTLPGAFREEGHPQYFNHSQGCMPSIESCDSWTVIETFRSLVRPLHWLMLVCSKYKRNQFDLFIDNVRKITILTQKLNSQYVFIKSFTSRPFIPPGRYFVLLGFSSNTFERLS